jgi:pyruvate/2-oxoglutarate dehydrogenase complex dihydrolipoamide dehydrogenase (E3) component/uncharacterized membrane protein YdjX (TVP38/TMEM64 family)
MRTVVLFFMVAALAAFFIFDLNQYLNLESLKSNQAWLEAWYQDRPIQLAAYFGLAYVLITAVSLPGAAILTLAAGAIFQLGVGTLLVSFASSIGATLAFLVSRFLLRDFVQNRFKARARTINEGIEKEGAFYLLTLRLVPLFPFFLVNLVMGLTSIRVFTFYIISQIGMLPGTLVYVNAGTELSKIDSLNGILSPGIILSMVLLGVFPIMAKSTLKFLKSRKVYSRFKRPKSFDYNIVVIGAGSGGLVTAYIAAAVKAKVALIEKERMGGDCLNTGCVPSKAFLRAAKVAYEFRKASAFGFEPAEPRFKFSDVMDKVRASIEAIAPHDSVERYSNLGVECIQGDARMRSPFEVEVNGRVLTAKNIVLATGAQPFVPPIPGLDQTKFLTSDTVWNLRELPKRLVILGGGPIGCELAQGFARLGSQVTLIEMAPRLMVREDPEVSAFMEAALEADGVKVLCGFKAVRVDGAKKTLYGSPDQDQVPVEFDEILIAVGRKARTKGFGLEELDLEIAPQGTIAVDEYMRTTKYPNIYVCGDAAGPSQFTHTASHQAWFAAVNSLFSPFKSFKVDYRVIPWCTFTDPEVARVGLNEAEAREKGTDFNTYRYDIGELDRAITEGSAHGFVKVLTAPGSDKILGVTIVGAHAGETIIEFITAMKFGLGLNKILSTIHIYPTMAEANKYAAGVWKRENAPVRALNCLQKFHQWRRS